MVTFAQAQERAAQWINGDMPAYEHRVVRVQEFELGYVVWAEDRPEGPRADGGAQRIVIARESGEATLWPDLPVSEVIRRYEEEYGAREESAPSGPAQPPGDLNQTSFLLTPPQWLQEAADRMGIPDRNATAEPASKAPSDTGSGAPAAECAGSAAGDAPDASGAPGGQGGAAEPAAAPEPAAAQSGGAQSGDPAFGVTPWAGTDTNADAGEDRSVPLPATVFAPPLSGHDEEETPPPTTSPEAKTALMAGGSQLPRTAVAPALDLPGGPAAPDEGSPQAPDAPGAGTSAAPGAPQPPGTPGAGTSRAGAAGGSGGEGEERTGASGAPSAAGASGSSANQYVPTQLVQSLGGPEGIRAPGPPPPPGSTPPPPGSTPPPPGTPNPPSSGGVHAAATVLADPSQGGLTIPKPGAPGTPPPPGSTPPPPGAPGTPGTPPRGTSSAGGGVHQAATMLASPAVGGPNTPPPPGATPPPPGAHGAPPGAPGGPGMPPPPPGQGGPGAPPPPATYGYPPQPTGQPTVGPGYQAVLRYRAADGSEQQIIRRSAPGTPHPEWQILYELQAMNVPPQQVLELHTELESCELPGGYCARMIRDNWPQARITSIAPYGRDHASRQQGMQQLLAHQGELHQVADGPARPAPVRVPLPQVPPAPPLPPEGVAQELAAAYGPGVFRFDQAAVSRQGVPEVVATTLMWAGLPLEIRPFFWAQAQPGRPVPTLLELAQERGVPAASDAGSYLVLGNDFGRAICVQYGTAHIVAVPVEGTPGAPPAPPQFVNTGLPEFVRCMALLGRMWRLRTGLNQEQAGRWTVDFQAQLASLDAAALGSPENWWAVLLEQMWDGLL